MASASLPLSLASGCRGHFYSLLCDSCYGSFLGAYRIILHSEIVRSNTPPVNSARSGRRYRPITNTRGVSENNEGDSSQFSALKGNQNGSIGVYIRVTLTKQKHMLCRFIIPLLHYKVSLISPSPSLNNELHQTKKCLQISITDIY